MFERTHITLTFSADLDGVPGHLHQAEDWVNVAKSYLLTNSHYNTQVTVHSIETIQNKFVDGKGWAPTRDPKPLFGYLEMEAALCVWETLNDWTLDPSKFPHARKEWAELRDGVGSAEMRHQSIALGKWCLAVYGIVTKSTPNIFDGVSYDWDVVPMILDYAEKNGAPCIYEEGLPEPSKVAAQVAHRHLRSEYVSECRREAQLQWGYGDLIKDQPERTDQAFELGEEPKAFVKWLGEKYDLTPAERW